MKMSGLMKNVPVNIGLSGIDKCFFLCLCIKEKYE